MDETVARTSREVFSHFIEAINKHDVDAIVSLMAADHVFIDSLGHRVEGAPAMRAGWLSYFAMCPDYHITVRIAISETGKVLAVGEAGGTIDGVAWRIPGAWEATVHDGAVAEWRVFADNKPVYDVLAKRKS
ncbi:MAG TPA: nuclear transport factor 2 family protein [Acidobacteriaceae bacterium]